MPSPARIVAACALAALCALPIAHAEVDPDGASAGITETTAIGETPAPAVIALRSAASATAVDLQARAAALPGRAQLGGQRVGGSALAALARTLPEPLRDRARNARDTVRTAYGTTRTAVAVASSLRGWTAKRGGIAAAADRVLDAAAALALGGVALVWALRVARRSFGSTGKSREGAVDPASR